MENKKTNYTCSGKLKCTNRAKKKHLCPYKQELFDDQKSKCNCCDDCMNDCVQSV